MEKSKNIRRKKAQIALMENDRYETPSAETDEIVTAECCCRRPSAGDGSQYASGGGRIQGGGARPKNLVYRSSQDNSKSVPRARLPSIDTENRAQTIYRSITRYEEEKNKFRNAYLEWKNERSSTIRALQNLAGEVHQEQLQYNQANLMFKQLNVASRSLKNTPSLDFWASLSTLVTDAVSGITTLAQAVNVDAYMEKFKNIIDRDSQATKSMYHSRSLYLDKYRNVEEIARDFQCDTLDTTVAKISDALRLKNLRLEVGNFDGGDAGVKNIVSTLIKFLEHGSNSQVVGEVARSMQNYAEINPAALESCKSAGKVIYDICDTFREKEKRKNRLTNNVSTVANNWLAMNERREVSRLQRMVENEDESQAQIESNIKDAINELEAELMNVVAEFESMI